VIHVYGVTHADVELPEDHRGLGDAPVRAVGAGEVAAVVSDLAAPPRTRADIEAHARVQGAIAERTTIVPLRFGTLMRDEDELRKGLLERPEIRELVTAMDGRVQMTVKALYEEDALLREIVRDHPELKRMSDRARGREERIALGERVARAVAQRRGADEDAIVRVVSGIADQVVVEEPGHEQVAARLQLLVRRDRREQLDAAVATVAAEQAGRMTVRYVGPLAPYSFCDLSLEAPAWAS